MNAEPRPRPVPGLGLAAIGAEEEALVLEVLRSKALFRYAGLDPAVPPAMTARLEKEFRETIGTDYALAVSSGTGALEVAMAAAGIGPGDEVIVTAWSWIACFTAIVRVGARPVLAEIDDTLNLDPAEIARLTTPRTRAVLVIHYQGVPADMERIQLEAHRRGLFVIEDCAQSIGSSYRGRKVGTWSDIATFSFQANKTMTSGEGGMVVTRDGWLYERASGFTIWATTGLTTRRLAPRPAKRLQADNFGCRNLPRRWPSRSCVSSRLCARIVGRCTSGSRRAS